METSQLTPDQLDAQVSRLHATEAWQRIVTGWDRTAPEPAGPEGADPPPVPLDPELADPELAYPKLAEPGLANPELAESEPACPPPVAAAPAGPPSALLAPSGPPPVTAARGGGARPVPQADWRGLLSVPVDQLIDESLRALPAPAPGERPLPGRLGAVLPERLHAWRRIGQPDVSPSTHLGHARRILTEWGWQNTPYRLRNARGARCLCGAMLTAHRLGYGSLDTVDRAGAWLITELRSQGWTGLIGPWNRQPGRTAAEALALLDATIHRAAQAGH
ncbi:hypothetical protein ABZ802_34520 [Streptomyces sp. NPDC047737]|uniref:DUF6197 family protein n=1 Tax=unclassified Streptomyces TaxID=2593676 RepID=UPI0033EC1FE2